MKARTLHRIGLIISSAMLIALSACAGDSRTTESPPAAAPRTTATEPRLLAEEYVEGEAVVLAVNKPDRTVTLRNAQGQSNTIAVPADVDLNRLKKGDTVLIGVYQTLSLRVLPPGSAALGATAAGGSTAPGQPEGRAWASNWSWSRRLPPSTSSPIPPRFVAPTDSRGRLRSRTRRCKTGCAT